MRKAIKKKLWFIAHLLNEILCILAIVACVKMVLFIFVSCVMVWVVLAYIFYNNAHIMEQIIEITRYMPKLVIVFFGSVIYLWIRHLYKSRK